MTTTAAREARRVGLGLFFGSVCVNAALGIYALVGGDFGETQGRILATSMSVTGALVVSIPPRAAKMPCR